MEVERPSFLQGRPCISRTSGLPRKVHPKQTQSISTTTPICPIRICIAFYKSENNFRTNQTPGKIQGRGAAAPFLVVSRGLQRGKAPTRIQRSDSCGKRRNNGTDDACPPQAADRMRDVEFVPTQIPLCWFPFHRQRPFPLTSKEKGAECRASGAKLNSRWLLYPSPLVLS